jgi:hypothetical protein
MLVLRLPRPSQHRAQLRASFDVVIEIYLYKLKLVNFSFQVEQWGMNPGLQRQVLGERGVVHAASYGSWAVLRLQSTRAASF